MVFVGAEPCPVECTLARRHPAATNMICPRDTTSTQKPRNQHWETRANIVRQLVSAVGSTTGAENAAAPLEQ
eukprot:3547075-Alexandrium_andersonii.AAC.1